VKRALLHLNGSERFYEYRGPKAAPDSRSSKATLRKVKTVMKLLGFDEEWQSRLAACVEETGVPPRCLIRQSVHALIEAIEKSGYTVVLPVEFVPKYVIKKD
jgi:hypothetical protein